MHFYALLSDEKVNFGKVENSKPELIVNKIVLREKNIQKNCSCGFFQQIQKISKKMQYKNAVFL